MERPNDKLSPARIVVNAVGDAVHGRLAESRFVERPFLPGGEHNLYEFAFAAAALGYEVELRGWLDRPAFDRLAQWAEVQPAVDLPARLPTDDDLVIVPEGWRDPLDYARLVLSPAHLALFVLAAPGLFGWPFVEAPWQPPDPHTVPLESVARPEHFRGMRALGFELLTHSPGIVSAAAEAGIGCALVGTGRLGWTAPAPVEKSVDVVAVLDNRWAPLAERVLGTLSDLSTDRIETVGNAEMLSRLARARVLVWPSRVEGHATIPWEARSVGCVPVALGSNRFAVGLDDAHGAVLVDEVEQLGPRIRAVLKDPSGWEAMSRRGRETAPHEVDWNLYVERVREFLGAPRAEDPGRPARAGLGAALGAWLERRAEEEHARLQEKASEIAAASDDLTAAMKNQERMIAEISHWRALHDDLRGGNEGLLAERERLKEALAALRAEHGQLALRLDALLARRSVRAALRVADTVKRQPR